MDTKAIPMLSAKTIAASQDVTHPEHHFSLGQVLATVLLGATEALMAYQDQKQIGGSVSSFIGGFLHIWAPGVAPQ